MDPKNLPVVAHVNLDKECYGCLIAMECGDEADLICDQCATPILTVPVTHVAETLTRMSKSMAVFTSNCPHCGVRNILPGFTDNIAYVCSDCGEGVGMETPIQ